MMLHHKQAVGAALLAVVATVGGAGVAAADQAAPGGVRGVAFFDRDADGQRDAGEPGRWGASVMVRDRAGNVVAEARTEHDGSYQLDGLRDGQYRVSSQNLGYRPTTREDVDVVVRRQPVAVNFGIDGGSISGLAWFDADGAGVREPDEQLLGGVGIRLYGPEEGYFSTGADGRYVIEDLPAGQYRVLFDSNAYGLRHTTPFAGADRTTDSDVDPDSASAYVILTISTGGVEDVQHVDAGYTTR